MNIGGLNISRNSLLKTGGRMLSAAAKDVIQNTVPNLAKEIGGPLGNVVIKEISRQVTGDPDTHPTELSAAIENGDADTIKAIKNAEVELARAGVDLERIHAEDRADAREAHAGSWHVLVVAGAIILAFFAMLFGLMYVEIPEGNREVIYALAGTQVSLVMMVGHFFFGSSEGSKQKTGVMARRLR